jgi:hypothetical protein
MKRQSIALLLISLFQAACDPAHIVRMEVSPGSTPSSTIPIVVAGVAQRLELQPSSDIKSPPVAGSLNYSRTYSGVGEGHPRSVTLSIEPPTESGPWHVEIFEWLVFHQSAFGKELQHALETALQSDGYSVKEVK